MISMYFNNAVPQLLPRKLRANLLNADQVPVPGHPFCSDLSRFEKTYEYNIRVLVPSQPEKIRENLLRVDRIPVLGHLLYTDLFW